MKCPKCKKRDLTVRINYLDLCGYCGFRICGKGWYNMKVGGGDLEMIRTYNKGYGLSEYMTLEFEEWIINKDSSKESMRNSTKEEEKILQKYIGNKSSILVEKIKDSDNG